MTQAREATGREAGATAGVIDGRSVKPTEAAMTRARRSRAASAISSPIRVACRSRSWCMRPTFGTAPGRRVCSPRRRYPIRGRATSLPMAVMAEGNRSRRTRQDRRADHRNHRALRYGQGGVESLPRRRVVEHTFARPGRCRREAKDVEATIKSAVARITIASIRLMISRLARA